MLYAVVGKPLRSTRPPIIQFAWGIPSAEAVAAIRKAGAKTGIQIASVAGVRRALDAGSDYLICQGTEAGGHVQATKALYEVLPAVIDRDLGPQDADRPVSV